MTAVERLDADGFAASVPDLAALLVDAVADGASVGFLAGLDHPAATAWWQARQPEVTAGRLAVWAARDAGAVVGTVSLAYPGKANARHRADLVKLAVRHDHRGRGLGRRLLTAAEHAAADDGITLLILDTETGSPAERLYRSAGWHCHGVVPGYAADPAGVLRDCSFLHKTVARP